MKITACNKDFKKAAVWYAKALGISRHKFDLTIDYEDSAKMIGAAQLLYYKGKAVLSINTTQCETDDEFELIAHEMVHLKQYVTGQMVDDLLTGIVTWEGVAYDACTDANSWAYWNAPWELEAFARMRGLNWMRTRSK